MINSYSCSYCPYKTTRIYNFKRHCRVVHKTIVEDQLGQEWYVQCPNCQYITKRVNDLKSHIKVTHNIKQPQNHMPQIGCDNTNIESFNKDCHKEIVWKESLLS